jgi:hypothetical protein
MRRDPASVDSPVLEFECNPLLGPQGCLRDFLPFIKLPRMESLFGPSVETDTDAGYTHEWRFRAVGGMGPVYSVYLRFGVWKLGAPLKVDIDPFVTWLKTLMEPAA